jgi:hypothetical protein
MDVFKLDTAVTKDNAAVVSHDTLRNALIPGQPTIYMFRQLLMSRMTGNVK